MKRELEKLLPKIQKIFEMSDIKRLAEKEEFSWAYSLINSTLEKGGPLIVGFNWGAEAGVVYHPEAEIEKESFADAKSGSIARSARYLEKIYGSDFASRFSQTNFCFFRSKTEAQISQKDVDLCKPVFEELIDIVQPEIIFCFSAKLRNYLLSSGQVEIEHEAVISFPRSATQNVTYKTWRGRFGKVKIVSLPHPNFKIPKFARDAAWKECFPGLELD